MDYWFLNDELSSIFLQPLIVTEGAVDMQQSHPAPDSPCVRSTTVSAHIVSIFHTAPCFSWLCSFSISCHQTVFPSLLLLCTRFLLSAL